MPKIKRIMALAGVILIIALYVITLILAVCGNENTLNLLTASLFATVLVPVLIWVYTFIYRLLAEHYSPGTKANPMFDENGNEIKKEDRKDAKPADSDKE